MVNSKWTFAGSLRVFVLTYLSTDIGIYIRMSYIYENVIKVQSTRNAAANTVCGMLGLWTARVAKRQLST